MRVVGMVLGLVAVMLLVAGCTDGGSDQAAEPGSSPTTAGEGADEASPTAGDDEEPPTADEGSPTAIDDGSPAATGARSEPTAVAVDEVRDGTWQVGDAGEVEFSLQDRALSLTDVRPSSGWEQRVADEKPDEIEVHFTQGTTHWKFEAELDDDNLEISRDQEIHQAEGGTYQVGFAQGGATADFEAELDDNGVELEIHQKVVGPIPN